MYVYQVCAMYITTLNTWDHEFVSSTIWNWLLISYVNWSTYITLTLFFRAEILYRCQIPPFAQSRSVLEPLLNNIKTEEPDILELCHIVQKEVLSLDGGKGVSEINFFNKWTH